MAKELRIKVDSFRRLSLTDKQKKDGIQYAFELPQEHRRYESFTRGQLITPADDDEATDLVERGIAEDPDAEHKRRQERLEREKQRLEAEQAQLDEQRKVAQAEQRAEKREQSGSK
jgi:hypothetical protein